MPSAGEKLVKSKLNRRRPFLPGRSLDEVAWNLADTHRDLFVGMTVVCAKKQIFEVLIKLVERGKLVQCTKKSGASRKSGLRRPTYAEIERMQKRSARPSKRRRPTIRSREGRKSIRYSQPAFRAA